jgi:hypothetical protein
MRNTRNKKTTKGYAEGGVVPTLESIYMDSLGRAPDAEGLAWYQSKLDEGVSIEDVQKNIQGSQAATNYRSSQDASLTADLETIFTNTLGRPIDAEGLAFYKGQVAEGIPLNTILGSIQGSQEAIDYTKTQADATAANAAQGVAAAQGARDLAAKAVTDPASLVEQSTVQSIATNPGQLVAAVPDATAEAAATQTAELAQAETAKAAELAQAAATQSQVQAAGLTQGTAAQADTTQADSTADAGLASGEADTVGLDELERGKSADFIAAKTVEPDLTEAKANEIIDGTEAASAQATSKATVRGQLSMLMEDFGQDGEATPVWASGSMRRAMQVMQSRGMGASSIAGAAVVQAAMESAMAIAVPDAQVNAQFEMQNLNNEQQTTIFKTQQRMASLFSDQAATNAALQFNASSENQTNQFFANMEAEVSKFNAAQVNAILQSNAENRTNVSVTNAAQANAQAQFNAAQALAATQFKTEQANISAQFNAEQANITSRLNVSEANKQAELNASEANRNAQLNASEANRNAQLNASEANRNAQINAAQDNAQSQFNVGEANLSSQFNVGEGNAQAKHNATLRAQNEQFNIDNSLIISQANAVWRQNVATDDTAAQNTSNREYTKNVNAVTGASLDQVWQRDRDIMDFAFTSSESALDRASAISLSKLSDDARIEAMELQNKIAGDNAASEMLGNVVTSLLGI